MRFFSPILFLTLTTFAACGGGPQTVPDAEANCGTELNSAPLPPRTSIDSRDLRPVVQIRYYRGNERLEEQEGTGVIVGRTSVLTVAHNLEPEPGGYNRIRIGVRDRDGVIHETPAIHIFINPSYNRFNYAGDLAMIEVEADLEALGITPATVATDYLPPRDCAECPNASDLQFYGYGAVAGPSNQLRGLNSNPLNPVRNIEETGVMTFQRYTNPGDSGGPYFRPNQREAQLVALHVGRDFYANDRFEVRTENERGTRQVAVATTIREADWNALNDDAQRFRSRNVGFGAPTYPTPDEYWPNGEENDDENDTSDNELPALPTHGYVDPLNPNNSTNGYFVGDYPAANVIHLLQPGPANGCG